MRGRQGRNTHRDEDGRIACELTMDKSPGFYGGNFQLFTFWTGPSEYGALIRMYSNEPDASSSSW